MLIRDILRLIPDDVLVHIFMERDNGSVIEICKDPCGIVRGTEGEFQNLEALCIRTMKSIEKRWRKGLRTNADICIVGKLQKTNAAKEESWKDELKNYARNGGFYE